MLVVLSDTHGTEDHRLTGAAREAVVDAELVIHAGDFSTEAVLDAFHAVAADLRGVYGNTDSPAVRGRLPPATTLTFAGVGIAVTHTREGGHAGITMFGREREADLVVFGHSHRPMVDADGDVTLLNPGSHADPRGNRQSFAVLEPTDSGLSGRLVTVDGQEFDSFTVDI